MEIRIATERDLLGLLLLLSELGYPTYYASLKSRFNNFVKNPGYGVPVLEKQQEVAGFSAWSQPPLFVSDTTRFHIEALVVSPCYRSQGIGSQLMQFVEDIAKGFSPCIIDLTSGVHRQEDGSHDFYKSRGYKNEGPRAKVYLRKEL